MRTSLVIGVSIVEEQVEEGGVNGQFSSLERQNDRVSAPGWT